MTSWSVVCTYLLTYLLTYFLTDVLSACNLQKSHTVFQHLPFCIN